MAQQEEERRPEVKHPIHPAVVHFPITLFPISTLFIVLWVWQNNPFFLHAAYWAFLLGALMTLPAGLTGFRDWRHTYTDSPQGRKVTYAHISLGLSLVVISLISGIFYLLHKPMVEISLIPGFMVITTLVTLMVMIQGFLGGLMVYTHRMGVAGHTR